MVHNVNNTRIDDTQFYKGIPVVIRYRTLLYNYSTTVLVWRTVDTVFVIFSFYTYCALNCQFAAPNLAWPVLLY
jgi:hypothetical protein